MDSAPTQDRIRQVIAGELAWTELTEAGRAAANAELDRAISERAASVSFGQELLAAGQDAVVLDGDGALICLHPDGTVTRL